jgi:hypothetical protein
MKLGSEKPARLDTAQQCACGMMNQQVATARSLLSQGSGAS